LFGVRNSVDKNAPCPCGSEKKFKKCCRKADVDATELALAQEEATERKAAVAALKAERQAEMDALKSQQEAVQETEQTVEFTQQTTRDTMGAEGADGANGAEEAAANPLDLALEEVPDGFFSSTSMDASMDASMDDDAEDSDTESTTVDSVKGDGVSEGV
jgi:hypothetical protein